MPWQGKERKLLLHPGRTGFMFVFDRETGELLSAEKYEPVTWANGYNLKTGLPDENPEKRPHFGQYAMDICPSSTGAKDFIPSAFSPRTGYLYIPAHNTCMDYEGTAVNYIAGTPYLGASVRMYPGPGGYQGEFVAWDVANAKKVWSIKDEEVPGLQRRARDRRRPGLLRDDGWLVSRGGRSHRQGSVAVQDSLRHHRRSDYVSRPGRQTIRRHLLRHRRMDGSQRAALGFDGRSLCDAGRQRAPCATSRPTRSRETRCMSSASKWLAVRGAGCWQLPSLVQRPPCGFAPIRITCPSRIEQQQGFENHIADLIAGDMGMQVSYVWFPQRRAFFRKTLDAGVCDVVMGVPAGMDEAAATRPYYRVELCVPLAARPASGDPFLRRSAAAHAEDRGAHSGRTERQPAAGTCAHKPRHRKILWASASSAT